MNYEAYLLLAIVGGAFAILCGYAVRYSLQLRKHVEEAYAQLAKHTDMQVVAPEPRLGGLLRKHPALHGSYQGRDCAVHCVGYGLDNTRQTDTAIRLESRLPKKLDLTLSMRNTSGQLAQAVRGKPIQTGNDTLDEQYLIKSRKPEHFDTPKHQTLIRLLAECLEANALIELKDGVLVYTRPGLIDSAEAATHWLAKLNSLIDSLSRTQESSSTDS